ncbi:probable metal-nicotianamine transporter YSL7 [Macadamia integrifolia]|uniref:probable metal-nicotianamine transporter YSL7 n=1 Tax=Macadamia integrifolia TaxID=60698 RepID=UPI001C4FC9FE|nr:probable metal-nicotianamine transporter YSL7 [Macadamia integrifolia]
MENWDEDIETTTNNESPSDPQLVNREGSKKKKEEEEDELTVEQIFQHKKVPSWRQQLTVRAFVVALVLSILFSFIVMKLNLTTGVIPSLNVSAGLLGFFFVKTWTKLLEKAVWLRQPFTRQENTVIQTCVVASAGISFSGGFGNYIYAMSEVVAKQLSNFNAPQDIMNPQIGWMMGFLFVVSFIGLFSVVPLRKLAFCNAYGCGLTDWSIGPTYGTIAIFVIGAWAGASQGGIIAGLAACGVLMNIVSTASDLTQDFKTGYLTLASPRSMFVSQVIGTAMGCVISPCVFSIFYKAFPDMGLPGTRYPAPYATVFRSMAMLGVEGFSSLPTNCLQLCYGFFFISIFINGIRDSVGKRWAKYIPSPMAMAIPFYIGAYFTIDMCIGSLILFVWQKVNRAKADSFGPAVASGLICGDGIWTLPSSILALAGVSPPICMKFLPQATNTRVDAFLSGS